MKGDPAIIDRLRLMRRDEVWLPQPVLAEIEYGIARLPPARRKRGLADAFHEIARELGRLAWTDAVSARFGEIKANLERRGERIDDFDLAIAAHALAHEAVLVTANRAHLARVPGLRIEDWSRRS